MCNSCIIINVVYMCRLYLRAQARLPARRPAAPLRGTSKATCVLLLAVLLQVLVASNKDRKTNHIVIKQLQIIILIIIVILALRGASIPPGGLPRAGRRRPCARLRLIIRSNDNNDTNNDNKSQANGSE